ncbi:response regulator [Luteolibacter pohnpeiensis]|uniref:histidine kinase n=1 Tax=Luteolibacter pohnpeiensis TaxID=454153 RepID=A0A934VUV4_9BACT|nr:response regulator [Luteolibacter pohnpeiensis]MBK1880894.1 response regulator [Luteolibacter pohnpeiensis]
MDYLVFMLGLFLLSAAAGAIMVYFQPQRLNRWLWLALAFSALGIQTWSGLLTFASGADRSSIIVLNALYGAVFCASLVRFALGGSLKKRKLLRLCRFLAVSLSFVAFFILGVKMLHSAAFLISSSLLAFAAGWRIPGWRQQNAPNPPKFITRLSVAVILSLIPVICMLPETVETAYDIYGKGQSSTRTAMILALTGAAAGSLWIAFLLWKPVVEPVNLELSANLRRRKRIGTTIIMTAAIITVTNGAWLAYWLGNQAQQEQVDTLISAINLGATTLESNLIPAIEGNPDETRSEAYLTLRSRLVNIHQALPKTRFVYLVGMRHDRLVFLVDAESPTSREFSPPGSPLNADPQKWLNTLGGNSFFGGPNSDEWGVWFTATLPIYAPGKRQAVAALGVDYPASEWLRPYAARRLAAMGVTVSVASLLLALFLLHLASISHTSRVDQLSERLTDAMKAAEFDTWEWFPKTLRLGMGERISTMLGWSNSLSLNPLRQIWRRVHPEDRRLLLNLLRSKPDEKSISSEAEIRLKDSQGRWLWFMLRGRVVNEDHQSGESRVVGTILNIDESHRSRIEIDKQRRFALHVMESVPNGLAVVSSDGFVAYANAAFIRMSKRSESQLIGMPLRALMAMPGTATGGRAGFEATLQCPDGTDVAVQAFQAPLEESGKEAGFILAVVDLTNIKDTELALRRSRAEADRLAFVAKRTDNAVLITDTQGKIEWANEGFTRMSGYTREEIVGKPEGHLLGRTNASHAALAEAKRKLSAGQGFETETENITKDGRSYLVHIECQPLFDNQGVLTGFMAIKRDITRSRRSATLLEAVASISTSLLSDSFEASMWQHIMEALGHAAMVDQSYLYTIHAHPQTGMPMMRQIAEWKSELRRIKPLPPLHLFDFQASGCLDWYQAWAAGHDIAGVVADFPAHQQKGLKSREIRSLVMVPIFAGDNLWGMLGFNVCTEDRHWEAWEIAIMRSAAANIGLKVVAQGESDALRLARDEANHAAIAAERANKAKSTFLATMSHEIRTPLNAVIGIASLLETTDLNTQQKDYAETILRSSHFLLELINDILDYSRIESGKIELESTPFSMPDLCREVFEVVRVASIGKDIEMICRIDPSIPEFLVGDSGRLRQILVNLLGNAVKFTHAGFVSLMVEGRQSSENHWDIIFNVKDSGIGIATSSMEKLFKPFIQEDSSTTRRFGGSGLGLAISKRLAQLMHGDIHVSSVQGEGSNFTASATLLQAPQLAQSSPANASANSRFSNLRVLIVDDNDLNRRILGEILSLRGIHCQAADSPAEAIAICKKSPSFDLILTDYRMPAMDGAELVNALKAIQDCKNTRFVLLGSDNSYLTEVRDVFDEICSKPVWPTAIHSLLSRLFPDPQATPLALSAKPAAAEPETDRLKGLRVLVAEDNPNNQKVVRLLLRRMGIDPVIVDDGQQAVDAVHANDYDIVFMDIQMPVMDGLEASARIKSDNLPHPPYVIALTANAFHEDRDAAAAAGMDGYLSKPITLAGLRKTLMEITQTTST